VEKARFGDRLQVEIDLEKSVSDQRIPTMVLQTLVENAVKHGIAVIKGEARIGIKIEQNNGFLQMEVTDNGPGPEKQAESTASRRFGLKSGRKKSGYGLKNVSSRLAGYFGDKGLLSLERLEDRGLTCVKIRIPLPETAEIRYEAGHEEKRP
jgi:two-component system sensor histidine kinase LytS